MDSSKEQATVTVNYFISNKKSIVIGFKKNEINFDEFNKYFSFEGKTLNAETITDITDDVNNSDIDPIYFLIEGLEIWEMYANTGKIYFNSFGTEEDYSDKEVFLFNRFSNYQGIKI